jgi:hypothetical protein
VPPWPDSKTRATAGRIRLLWLRLLGPLSAICSDEVQVYQHSIIIYLVTFPLHLGAPELLVAV